MRAVLFGVLALSLSAPAFAQATAQGTTAVAPGAIAGAKVTIFDAARKSMTVDANGQKYVIDISKAAIAGTIQVGVIVDVTHTNNVASAVAVRGGPPPQQQAAASGTQASAPGAIAGGKVVEFDPQKRLMKVDANGQKLDILLGDAVVSGEVAVGKIVDVTFANGKAVAVSVR